MDQHAADERCRLEALEALLAKNPAFSVQPPMLIAVPSTHLATLRRRQESAASLGLEYAILENSVEAVGEGSVCISVLSLPIALMPAGTPESLARSLISLLAGTVGVASIRSAIQRELASRACHGAIRFGDALAEGECQRLLSDLATCRLPFQCAHGRPTVVPLVHLPRSQYG